MIHRILIKREYMESVLSGQKTFEIRNNDRNYRVGDIVVLVEVFNGIVTGRTKIVKISYVLKNVPQYGLADGFCIFSWKFSEDDDNE